MMANGHKINEGLYVEGSQGLRAHFYEMLTLIRGAYKQTTYTVSDGVLHLSYEVHEKSFARCVRGCEAAWSYGNSSSL